MLYSRDALAAQIQSSINGLEKKNIVSDTHEWYLRNHLNQYLFTINSGADFSGILEAADKFGMYCTDSMNWDTEEYKNCIALSEYGRKLAKKEMKEQA